MLQKAGGGAESEVRRPVPRRMKGRQEPDQRDLHLARFSGPEQLRVPGACSTTAMPAGVLGPPDPWLTWNRGVP